MTSMCPCRYSLTWFLLFETGSQYYKDFKGIAKPKLKIVSLFAHRHVDLRPNTKDFVIMFWLGFLFNHS